jgi:uncharacterized protein (TIGR04255 family)
MPSPRHLVKAPITEAVLDIRVKASASVNPEFPDLPATLLIDFPKLERQAVTEFAVPLLPAALPEVRTERRGVFLKSADEKQVVQFRTDGFTVNRLRPYTSWEQLFPQALTLWELYRGMAQPEAVTRIALRYINQISMPPEALDTWMRMPPRIPPELPQTLDDFSTRLTFTDQSTGLSARVTQLLQLRHSRSLVLDIDAYQGVDWHPSDPRIKDVLQTLHDFKNEVFFNLLTEAMLGRFE